MTNHRNCLHPATSSGRAKCRRERAQEAAYRAEAEAELAPLLALKAARDAWYSLSNSLPEAIATSASANADDTSLEEGFEVDSLAWFECAMMTAQRILDTTPADEV
jgi:hypothetical protein